MGSSVIQRSFSAGEIAPALHARADLVKYQTGLKTLRNFVTMREGGAENRAGTEFVAEVKDSFTVARLIPFTFNDEQTYALEFGDEWIRFYQNGAQVLEAEKTITGATAANPVVITSVAHGYSSGEEVFISGVVGMTQINGKNFRITVLTADTFSLQDLRNNNINGSTYTAYSSGGTAERVYTLTSPYDAGDVFSLQYEQSGDIITLTHRDYAPRELRRQGHTSWTISAITFSPSLSGPMDGRATSAGGTANTYRYKVTAIRAETYEESLPGYERSKTGTTDRTVTPWAVTTTSAHGYSTGDEVYFFSESVAFLGLSGNTYTITVTGSDTFTLDDTTADSGASGALDIHRTWIAVASDEPADDDPITIQWDPIEGADIVEYNVYKESNGVFGYIGTAGGTSFQDINITPDITDQPPTDREVFEEEDDYPATASYAQQRLGFAGTNNDPNKVWCSQVGNFHNITISTPANDDDAVVFTVDGGPAQEVRHLLELGRLLIFTRGGIWMVQGDADGVLRPGAINLRLTCVVGSSTLKPIPIGSTALFVQARGSVVRDLRFELNSESFKGNELSLMSNHLLRGYTIVDWAWQETPHNIVWMVRSDGVLLGMTYLPDHEVVGWHRHDTEGGIVESVCCIPEDDEDAVYLVVRRTIDGTSRRYVERLHTRNMDTCEDAFFVDCGLSYDGRNTDDNITMTLSGGTTWTAGENLTLTASTSYFTSSEVGNAIVLRILDDDDVETSRLVLNITSFTSDVIVTVQPEIAVEAAFRNTAFTDWSRAVDVVGGLDHLEGETVSILADGNEMPQQEVEGGEITFDDTYSVIHVGLPIQADLETLNLDTVNAETFVDKQKLISKVTVMVQDSRGGKVGHNEDGPFREFIQRTASLVQSPIPLRTGREEVLTSSSWDDNGRIFIRQDSPLPLTILSVVPSGRVGG